MKLATRPGRDVLVSGVRSDSHTWNLVYLQLLLEDFGHRVINLGACVPDEMLIAECRTQRPDLVVVSTVNGLGHQDGLRLIRRLRAAPELAETPIVIGGKLGIDGADPVRSGTLIDAGFDAVFEDDADIADFDAYVTLALGRAAA